MASEFMLALTQLCNEKNIAKEVVIQAIEQALVSAYRRKFNTTQSIVARIDTETGEAHVYAQRKAVAEVTDPQKEISLEDARAYKADAQLDEVLDLETTPQDFGRIAAQTAKQVVMQRLREAEREVVFHEYTDRSADIVTGTVQRIDPNKGVIIDLNKAEGMLPNAEQIPGETYHPGQRLKVYVVGVERSTKGPQVTVSRAKRDLVRRLFELEVPEIYTGTVEIKSIAREAGSRTKVAVAAKQEGVDPVGSCVGQRGVRIQNVLNELGTEKIDVIQWSADPVRYVANALSPAQVQQVEIDEDGHTAIVVVDDKQLSLAIGKEGQNARLAAKLTGWRIDIKPATVFALEPATKRKQPQPKLTVGGEEENLLAVRLQQAFKDKGEAVPVVDAQAEQSEQPAPPPSTGA
jgi:transcription termination/antitermination protein NusA